MWFCLFTALALPPETDVHPPLQPALQQAGVQVALRMVQEPVTTALEATVGGKTVVLADSSYRPDRVALAADGALAAFVSGRTGLASVYVVPTDGSRAPVQLTNVGLDRTHREGFVPPPAAAPVFREGRLHWTDGEGVAHAVRY